MDNRLMHVEEVAEELGVSVSYAYKVIRRLKSYQRLHGEDVITTPKTKKSNRTIKMPPFLCDEMQDYLKMLYGLKNGQRSSPPWKKS